MVNLAVIFDVKTLLNVTEFLPTAIWISATYSLLFSTANSKNQKCLNETRCPLFLSPRFVTSRVFDNLECRVGTELAVLKASLF